MARITHVGDLNIRIEMEEVANLGHREDSQPKLQWQLQVQPPPHSSQRSPVATIVARAQRDTPPGLVVMSRGTTAQQGLEDYGAGLSNPYVEHFMAGALPPGALTVTHSTHSHRPKTYKQKLEEIEKEDAAYAARLQKKENAEEQQRKDSRARQEDEDARVAAKMLKDDMDSRQDL